MTARDSDGRKPDVFERIRDAQANLISLAASYASEPSAETWRDLCRAKATLDALMRCVGWSVAS